MSNGMNKEDQIEHAYKNGKGDSYLGSGTSQTSVAGDNILPLTPDGWTNERYRFVRFSLRVAQPCTIVVNNTGFFPMLAGEDFSVDENNPRVRSIQFMESSISYRWAGII